MCQLTCGKIFCISPKKSQIWIWLPSAKWLRTIVVEVRKTLGAPSYVLVRMIKPVSSEISDLCEISDLLLFFSYFASQNKEIKSGNYFSDVCCVN